MPGARTYSTLSGVSETAFPISMLLQENVSNPNAIQPLIDAGADGILVGQGPGSICTTRVVAGVGCPQVSAVYKCVQAANGQVPICADGGIQHPGDIAIALAVGASSVMLGSILAGTDKSPGDVVQVGNEQVKLYRGMGSLGAMRDSRQSRERYSQGNDLTKVVPEGVEATVRYAGPLQDVLTQYNGGVQSSMGYLGAPDLETFRAQADIFRVTSSGQRESHPHDLHSQTGG